ncbi:unnamed protein product [Effrenium voratum]|uniref:4-hydroxyphenylpyruvate dioxygenase n=1 Tax=Effrenium voratum TaxID=2562239 RepID=A0AA36N9J8_9DINO|nr:unnamed protein product [Effrenium voratum]
MSSKLVLLPTLLAAAFVLLCAAPSFVFGGQPATTSSLRTARSAVPEALELETSISTALEVSTPGWWANIVTLVVPLAILITLYLQSERRKSMENHRAKALLNCSEDVALAAYGAPLLVLGRLEGALTPPAPAQAPAPTAWSVSFSHVHIYCDELKELSEYKSLESKLNEFNAGCGDLAAARQTWLRLWDGKPAVGTDPAQWRGHGQDVVEQMLVGLGFRVTGFGQTSDTRTMVVTSKDAEGVKFVITAHDKVNESPAKRQKTEAFDHLDAKHLERFAQHRAGRQGIAVLGFKVKPGELDGICKRYAEKHPKLLREGMPKEYPGAKILEVFAYYQGETGTSDQDPGTVLRFVEGAEDADFWVLPGLKPTAAAFDSSAVPAYCDHWVSNVVSRRGFLDTLEETLGFTPKVDFNAGVVAAGEAQIESTVTGNEPGTVIPDPQKALKDQSQVYLPINNALSEVGHVHLYLKEIGQGVQHIASRVEDLPALVQKANDMRKITGAGLSFLSIPRSYYGSLTARYLCRVSGLEEPAAQKLVAALRGAGLVDANDILDLDVSRERVLEALPSDSKDLLEHVMRARYGNLHALLRDHISEDAYLRIVRNNVLVDVQGDDLLLQIFTNSILQRAAGEEAPFLEFIQRVCSDKKDPVTGEARPIKAGCGGFGIRNFLTLFLSIEVSKATRARAEAQAAGKTDLVQYYGRMVDAFTSQLEESNPVLTAISDAMTFEGEALEAKDAAKAQHWADEKVKGQQRLQEISSKYKDLMRTLRERAPEMA